MFRNARASAFLTLLLALSLLSVPGGTQCPAVGADVLCGIVITVTDQGAAISFTGQPPYSAGSAGAGIYDDTLIGVINNSSVPIATLGLNSPLTIFAFTHNGIDTFGVPGNGLDQSGYGGPNAYFSGVDGASQSGLVNFIAPIAPGGGTGFFSLATNLTSATACTDLINAAVAPPSTSGTQIQSSFTPNQSKSLSDAAALCGFTSFNWQQLVLNLPQPSPFHTADVISLFAPLPFNDPPPNGYDYQYPHYNAVVLPVYYNIFEQACDPLSLAANESATTLKFSDAPADACLYGSTVNLCGSTALPGAVLSFSTHLVGVIGNDANAVVQDTGVGFTWNDSFNGTSGGISVLNSTRPVDPGSGSGGIAVTSYNPNTNYRFPKSLSVTSINGKGFSKALPARILSSSQISVAASGLAYSRATRAYTGSVTISNIGSSALSGPFQILLMALTPNVNLVNATGTFGGAPFITLPGASTLAPGDSIVEQVRFSDPSMVSIQFYPTVYTGGFN